MHLPKQLDAAAVTDLLVDTAAMLQAVCTQFEMGVGGSALLHDPALISLMAADHVAM